jgi:hypothetical protein
MERAIIFSAYVIIGILLVWFVPKHKMREATTVFTFKLMLDWVLGLLVVEYRLIEYPIRLFSYATRSSFAFEYIVYPSICVLFNLYYPFEKAGWRQFLHYVFYCSALTSIEYVLERNTRLIDYINWEWYWTWIALFITFYISNQFYRWFYKK